MRLTRFRVEGLFGLFDHDIPLNKDERITIIHAPNGYGKTVVLNFISSMFGGGSLVIFRQVEFKNIIMDLDDKSKIVIQQGISPEPSGFSERDKNRRTYSITYTKGKKVSQWEPYTLKNREAIRREIPLSMWDRYIPHVSRLGPSEWRDHRFGDIIGFDEIMDRYSEFLPPSARKVGPHPDWLTTLRASVHCQLIETQRLMVRKKDPRPGERDEAQPLIPAVKTYAADLAGSMGRALAESATVSQSLERTFPNRLLARMRDDSDPLTEDVIRQRLTELEQLRARLTKVDLLDKSAESAAISDETFDVATRKILSEYVDDAQKKLNLYTELLVRIELFSDLVNDRFKFKALFADRLNGFRLVDIKGRSLEAGSLSSGEQHELVLFYDLIFKTKTDTLILIDEPEISLHIAWQKRFLSDLRRIIELSPMDVILSTHSPQLIGSNINLAIQLMGPSGEASDV